jgi:hypothetical protein
LTAATFAGTTFAGFAFVLTGLPGAARIVLAWLLAFALVALRAASRRALERWGRVRGRLARTPSDASASLGRAFLLVDFLARDRSSPLDVLLMAR